MIQVTTEFAEASSYHPETETAEMKKVIWKNRWFAVWYFYHPAINRGVGIDFLVRDGSGDTSHGYAYYFGL